MNRLAVCAAALALLVPVSQGVAQTTKPWQLPGTRVGEEIVGPNGARMVWVPAGEFTMGSVDGPADEKPAHRVRISRGFWLSKTAVTLGQWKRYCRESGVPLKEDILSPTDDYPMDGLSWLDVRKYCQFYGLAMPTEAQWEYAARGPEGRTYPWGNWWDKNLCCNDDNVGPQGYTCPVGSYPKGASWCGALDMAGNLSTWCADWYSQTYYANSPSVDPTGPERGTERVERGGYCWGSADECRSARRFGDDPTNDGGSGSARPCFTPAGTQG